MNASQLFLCCAVMIAGLVAIPVRHAYADDGGGFGSRLKTFREMIANKRENDALKVSEEDLGAHTGNVIQDGFNGRDMILWLYHRCGALSCQEIRDRPATDFRHRSFQRCDDVTALMCETGLYQSVISLAGSLMAEVDSCTGARGRTILAIHGSDDLNVPPGGGKDSKGVTNIDYKSENDSKSMFEKSGGKYIIQLLPDTDHNLEHIGATIQNTEGISLAEKAARFFGLAQER